MHTNKIFQPVLHLHAAAYHPLADTNLVNAKQRTAVSEIFQ